MMESLEVQANILSGYLNKLVGLDIDVKKELILKMVIFIFH